MPKVFAAAIAANPGLIELPPIYITSGYAGLGIKVSLGMAERGNTSEGFMIDV